MIRRLKIKIIIVISLILTLTVTGIMAAINIISRGNNQAQIETRLQRIVDNDGFLPVEYDNIDPYHGSQASFMDGFSVQLDRYYTIRRIILSREIVVRQDTLVDYVNQAVNSGQRFGEIGSYAYMVSPKTYGTIVVFQDVTPYQQANSSLLMSTIVTGIIAVLFFCGISIAMANWLVMPVRNTFDKQKRFISDASHELKTPLAVISANVDVLEAESGENKWIGYIRNETNRMSELVNELLSLARLDDKTGNKLNMTELDLSALVMQTALPFESTAFEMGKKYDVEAQPDVFIKGDESSLRHVLTILIDNALKYSDKNGEINVRLYTRSNKKYIEVYNTGRGVAADKLKRIFERFYREDEARNSKSGGYGLGLAIAKASIEAHGGKITAQSEQGSWIRFTAIL